MASLVQFVPREGTHRPLIRPLPARAIPPEGSGSPHLIRAIPVRPIPYSWILDFGSVKERLVQHPRLPAVYANDFNFVP